MPVSIGPVLLVVMVVAASICFVIHWFSQKQKKRVEAIKADAESRAYKFEVKPTPEVVYKISGTSNFPWSLSEVQTGKGELFETITTFLAGESYASDLIGAFYSKGAGALLGQSLSGGNALVVLDMIGIDSTRLASSNLSKGTDGEINFAVYGVKGDGDRFKTLLSQETIASLNSLYSKIPPSATLSINAFVGNDSLRLRVDCALEKELVLKLIEIGVSLQSKIQQNKL